MRVLLTSDTIGGVWTFTQELTRGLLEQGHSVALVSLGRMPSQAQQAWVDDVDREYGGAFYFMPLDVQLEWMDENELACRDAEPRLLRVLERVEADVLHASQFCFGALPTAVPKVVTAHSDVLSWAEACRPGGLEDSEWLRNYCVQVEAGLDGADAVVAPTEWMWDALSRHFELKSAKRVIANGLTLEIDNDPKQRRLQAVSAGRVWDEAKHLSLLGEVAAAMPIVIAGEQTLGANTSASKLGQAELLGLMNGDEVRQLFSISSLYLVPSIYEPFGLAPLEAALCGCGVLANDLPSLREVWGDAALYFTDAASLDLLLSRLAGCPAALHTLRRHCLERAHDFSRKRMTDAYVALYQELLDRPRAVVETEEVAMYGG